MATITTGHNAPTGFTSGEVVTATKLNNHVNSATVTGIVNADIDAAAAIAITKLANPQYTGFRNRIINGNFDIWQRGTSFTANAYGADRWGNSRAGSTCTMSRQEFTLGQTDVPNEPTYFVRMTVSSVAGAGNFVVLSQPIESVRSFGGQTITVSFHAKADSFKTIALELAQFFGTGGSPSSIVTGIGAQKFDLTTSWQKFTATISVPSIAGKTVGTNADSHLTFGIWLDAGSNFNSRTDSLGQQSGTFDIAQVQVEAGTVATPFEARPIGTELALCQRYYYRNFPATNAALLSVGGNCESTTAAYGAGTFPVAMRATPSAIETTGTASDYRVVHSATSTVCSAVPTINTATTNLIYAVNATVASGLTAHRPANLMTNSTAAFIAFNAEL